MNIFVLDSDPFKAADYHCDQHVVKMILESAQLLSTEAYRAKVWDSSMYLPTHAKHSCTVWLADNPAAIVWLTSLVMNLSYEYGRRFRKTHKASIVAYKAYDVLHKHYNMDNLSSNQPDKFVLAMPEQFKADNPVQSYRSYYQYKYDSWKLDTRKAMRYTNTKPPEWLKL